MNVDETRAELRTLTKSDYCVNQKNPRTYNRGWKLYTLGLDGIGRTYIGADSPSGYADVHRRALAEARQIAAAVSATEEQP